MSDKPILFSAPMIRALLDGRKTQTRRALKPPYGTLEFQPDGTWKPICTKFFPGDRLWVREQCATWEGRANDVVYRATEPDQGWADLVHDQKHGAPWKRRTSIHMPRWASRLTLIVTDVRVQRLQDISDADALAEGCRGYVSPCGDYGETPREEFHGLWNSIHGPDAWDANPWVVALTFDVHRSNIDQMGAA